MTEVHVNWILATGSLFEQPFVKRFVLCYQTVILSVCPVLSCVVSNVAPPPPKGTWPPNFCSMSIVAKQSPVSATAEHL